MELTSDPILIVFIEILEKFKTEVHHTNRDKYVFFQSLIDFFSNVDSNSEMI